MEEIISNGKKKDNLKLMFERMFNKNGLNPDNSQLEKALLKMIKNNDWGISLYRTTHDDLNTEPNGGWKELVLDFADNSVLDEPCNE